MNDEEDHGPAQQAPHGSAYQGRCAGPYPFPPHPRQPPARQDGEVTIMPVANGWIVTSPAPEGPDDEADGMRWEPGVGWAPDTQRHVFGFEQKDAMVGFVAEVTPAEPRRPE